MDHKRHLAPNFSRLKILGLFVCLWIFCGCGDTAIFDQTESLGETGWLQTKKIEIPFEIKDTLVSYALDVSIRQSNDYSFYNLYFVPQIIDSKGKVFKKALAEAILYDAKSGKAKGAGLGDMYSHSYSIFPALHFPKAGKYTLRLEQYMRTDTLTGVVSVGAALHPNSIDHGKN
jgi:gliding motility-associated lipoprotein GldH